MFAVFDRVFLLYALSFIATWNIALLIDLSLKQGYTMFKIILQGLYLITA